MTSCLIQALWLTMDHLKPIKALWLQSSMAALWIPLLSLEGIRQVLRELLYAYVLVHSGRSISHSQQAGPCVHSQGPGRSQRKHQNKMLARESASLWFIPPCVSDLCFDSVCFYCWCCHCFNGWPCVYSFVLSATLNRWKRCGVVLKISMSVTLSGTKGSKISGILVDFISVSKII